MNTFLSKGKKNYNYELISNSNTTIQNQHYDTSNKWCNKRFNPCCTQFDNQQKKVMHRDLKSKNVPIDIISNKNLALGHSSLHVKVTDFRLSKLQDRYTTHCMWIQLHGWILRCLEWTTSQTQLMCIVLQWFSSRSSLGRYHLLTYSGLTSIKALK